MQKLLTTVVPVYNVEQYINKCLDSCIIAPELMRKMEVLVINDGTPDKSAVIAKNYERQYPGVFRVIDQENRGHGGAWNHGTELATGKYLFYLDSDDWVDTQELSRLITFLEGCDTDMVLLDKKKYYADKDRFEDVVLLNMEPDRVYDANTFDWLGSANGSNITYAHNAVYLTSMMQQFLPLFCEHVKYDDVSLQVIPIAIAESFVYTKLNVYRYRIGRVGQSFDPTVRSKSIGDVTKVLMFVYAWMKKHQGIVPSGTTRRIWFEEHMGALGSYHYYTLSRLPFSQAKDCLKEWDAYMRQELEGVKVSNLVSAYRCLPFSVYYTLFKIESLWEKGHNRIKRMIHG